MSKITLVFISIFSMSFFFFACQKLENNVELEMESTPNELVVECYLEAGQPYRVLLTETKDYFDIINICPFVQEALVVLTHNGIKDTLQEASFSGGCNSITPYYNADSTRFFNYGSATICPVDYNHDFVLEIWDKQGERYATARTRFIPSVPISTFSTTFNLDTTAYCTIGCQDAINTANYYRIMLHKNTLSKIDSGSIFKYIANKPYIDEVIYDQPVFAGQEVLQSSDYHFYRTDRVIGTIYHIDQAYHDYLLTARRAAESNFSPFVEPTQVISNIEGGNGIFTFLSYDRDTLYIPWF